MRKFGSNDLTTNAYPLHTENRDLRHVWQSALGDANVLSTVGSAFESRSSPHLKHFLDCHNVLIFRRSGPAHLSCSKSASQVSLEHFDPRNTGSPEQPSSSRRRNSRSVGLLSGEIRQNKMTLKLGGCLEQAVRHGHQIERTITHLKIAHSLGRFRPGLVRDAEHRNGSFVHSKPADGATFRHPQSQN